MNVLIIFEPAYEGSPSDAVWIIDTPQNRGWFKRNSAFVDQNSAVFAPTSDPLNILWSVFEHHPAWTEIAVRGMKITSEIVSELASDALVEGETPGGFMLKRLR